MVFHVLYLQLDTATLAKTDPGLSMYGGSICWQIKDCGKYKIGSTMLKLYIADTAINRYSV